MRDPDSQGHTGKGGHYFLALKNNQAELKDWAEYLLQYPAEDEHVYHQVRSGTLWVWRVRTTAQIPAEKELSFPGLQQIVEIYRHKTHKRSGAIVEETHLAVTCSSGCCDPGANQP